MFVKLEVVTEAGAGPSIVVEPGQTVRVGRVAAESQLAIPDKIMSPAHFSITCDAERCTLRDISQGVKKHARCASDCALAVMREAPCPPMLCGVYDLSAGLGVHLNKKKVAADEVPIKDADIIVAGSTTFRAMVSEQPFPSQEPPVPALPPPEASAPPPKEQEAVLAFLAQRRTQLYALVDAARDPALLPTLRVHAELHYPLYDGLEAVRLEHVAPYLVELPPGSPLTELLVRRHWGGSWGLFLHSGGDFAAVRKHLRRFLVAEDEKGKQTYFRFYDPRVLRLYLPTCTSGEADLFFGPIYDFIVESAKPSEMLVFTCPDSGVDTKVVRL